MQPITNWLHISGTLAKCADGFQVYSTLLTLKDYDDTKLQSVRGWVQTDNAIAACTNGNEISLLLLTFKGYQAISFSL